MTEQAKILIVDDSADNRFLLRMLLEDDHLVSEADSGEACLSSIEQDKPDLLLLDVKMPGLDGYQVCQELRKKSETEDLPIIFVSGLDSSEERLAGFEAGGDEYIIKPVDETDLLTKVSSYLNKQKEREAVHHDASQSMKMALEAMTVSSELGQIIGFVKSGQSLKTHKSIGEAMLSIADDFQLNASVMVKAETPFFFGCDANSVEANFLAKAAESSERMLMIGVRFVIRDKNIVMIIKDLPIDDENKMGRLKDHLAVLMDIANGYLDNVNAQYAIKNQRKMFMNEIIAISEEQINKTSTKINSHGENSTKLIQKMVSNLEDMLFGLGLDEDQEKQLMGLADKTSVELEELNHLTKGLDSELGVILESLYSLLAAENTHD